MTEKLTVVGILVDHRAEKSPEVQKVLCDYGKEILMRSGIPSSDHESGLITLVVETDKCCVDTLIKRLETIGGVKAKSLDF